MLNFSIPTQKKTLKSSSVKARLAQSVVIQMTGIPGSMYGSQLCGASPGLPGTVLAAASKTALRGRAA